MIIYGLILLPTKVLELIHIGNVSGNRILIVILFMHLASVQGELFLS